MLLLALERDADGVEETLIVERLLDEVESSLLHRLDGEGHVGMSRHDDDRQADTAVPQRPHEGDAVGAWHADIGDDAARRQLSDLREERVGALVQPHRQPVRREKE